MSSSIHRFFHVGWARPTSLLTSNGHRPNPLPCKEGQGEVEASKRRGQRRKILTTLCVILATLFFTLLTLAQETDKDMPVGAVGGTVHADLFTGTATTSIPIEVPPGRGGV